MLSVDVSGQCSGEQCVQAGSAVQYEDQRSPEKDPKHIQETEEANAVVFARTVKYVAPGTYTTTAAHEPHRPQPEHDPMQCSTPRNNYLNCFARINSPTL